MSGSTWPYPRWIAHRGAGKLAPENTLAAFREGARYGYRAFECDAKLSADGVPFLLHDATLERTTDGSGSAGAKDWSELSRLDAGSWHSRGFAGEPLPTLRALMRFCLSNGYALDLEIKPTPGLEEQTGRIVAAQAHEIWSGHPGPPVLPPLLSSFRPECLRGAREAAPELPRALLLDSLWDGWFDVARALDCRAVVTNHTLMDDALIARLRQAGLRALVYTVNDPAEAQRQLALGTDGIITDAVDRFPPFD